MDDSNWAVGVWRFIVAGRWNRIGLDGQHTGNEFQQSTAGAGMAEAALWCRHWGVAQFGRNRLSLSPVHGNRAQPVGVDMPDTGGIESGPAEHLAEHQPDTSAGGWILPLPRLTAGGGGEQSAADSCPAAVGMFSRLQHHHPSTLSVDEPITIEVEGATGGLEVIVAGGQLGIPSSH